MLIKDNAELRSYIPNSFGQVMGGVTLYEKMLPFLQTAESWLVKNIIGGPLFAEIESSDLDSGEPLYFLPRRVVTLRAWQLALPALDVLVTNNGIGAAETDTIKPASKAKIDRLLLTTAEEIDIALEMLVDELLKNKMWWGLDVSDPFNATLFSNYSVLRLIHGGHERNSETETIHDRYVRHLPKIFAVEKSLAMNCISMPVYRRLRSLAHGVQVQDPKDESAMVLLGLVKHATVTLLNDLHCTPFTNPKRKQMLGELSAFILDHREDFPEWDGSLLQQLFDAEHFKNKEGATGHWL